MQLNREVRRMLEPGPPFYLTSRNHHPRTGLMQNSTVKHVRLFSSGNFRYCTVLKNFYEFNLLKVLS